MTTQDAVSIAEGMYLNRYGEPACDVLGRAIEDACLMVENVSSPNYDSGNRLRSTQVIAGIVVAYRMTRGETCHD